MKEPESDPWAVFPDPSCGYCGRHFREHSEQDFWDCAVRSGGKVMENGGCVINSARLKGEDPDPAKRAAKRREMLPKIMESVCECGKTIAEHSMEDILSCDDKQRNIQLKAVRCPICNKLALEHSQAERKACREKYKATEH